MAPSEASAVGTGPPPPVASLPSQKRWSSPGFGRFQGFPLAVLSSGRMRGHRVGSMFLVSQLAADRLGRLGAWDPSGDGLFWAYAMVKTLPEPGNQEWPAKPALVARFWGKTPGELSCPRGGRSDHIPRGLVFSPVSSPVVSFPCFLSSLSVFSLSPRFCVFYVSHHPLGAAGPFISCALRLLERRVNIL